MEEFIKVSAKSVEDAVLEASIQLGTTRENIEYNIIEHETKGFLGIGAKKAIIEARKKESFEDSDIIKEVFSGKSTSVKKSGKKAKAASAPKAENSGEKENKKSSKKEGAKEKTKDKARDKKADKTEKAEKPEKAEKAEKANKQDKADKPDKADKQDKAQSSQKNAADNTVKEKSPEKAEKSVKAERAPKEPADPKVAAERAEAFLTDIFKAMDMDVEQNISFADDTLSIELSGDDMGVLIGKRGQTLDSIQYLTSLIVNKGKASYVRVKVDTENYRERRRATLENLAKNIAFKVKKTRKTVYLEPMNPYERRIIHSSLQNDPFVTTHSEGEEPLRKVVVTLKKREKPSFDEEE